MPAIQFATIATIQAAVLELMAGPEPLFWAIGIRLFQGFALIQIVLLGVSIATNGRGSAAPVHEFMELILFLSFGYAMVTFYAAPIPGLGISFASLIPAQAQHLANILDARALEQTFFHLDVMASKLVAPTVWNVPANFAYWALLIVLAITKAMALLVIVGPMIAQAILVLIGGIFVPFFIVPVPQLQFLFWGWVKGLLATSFALVVAMAYLMIASRFFDRLVLTIPVIAPSQYPLYIGELIMFALVFAVGAIFIIPVIVSMLFSAHAPTVRVPGL